MSFDILFKELVRRAFQDTRAELGLSWGMAIRSVAALVGTILVYYMFKSEVDVVSVWEGGFYSLLVFMLVFLPHFLWNLWLAPYRLLQERLDALEKHLKDIHSESPGEEWGAKFRDRCERLSFEIAPIPGFNSRTMPELMTELRIFCSDLEQYGIAYPPISERHRVKGDNRVDSDVKLWGKYLLILRTCTQQGDLKRAQNIYDELSRSDQELWKRMEEASEALADSE